MYMCVYIYHFNDWLGFDFLCSVGISQRVETFSYVAIRRRDAGDL